MRYWIVGLFLLLLAVPARGLRAQNIDATLTGTVTNAATGGPIEGANVFIATSMNGTTTDAQGRYRLTGIPLGTLRLYVSFVGFEPQFLDLFIRSGGVQTFDFVLEEAIVEIGEITVTSENEKWKRQLEKFITLFIGETPNAAQTEITNPEVLDFSAKGGEFRAHAGEPLVIENRALGYRVRYFLGEFVSTPNRVKYDGEPLFEEMQAESPEQRALWRARRDSAFYGSFRHFMLAAINGQVKEQGFEIYSRPASRGVGGAPGRLTGSQRYPIQTNHHHKDGEAADQKVLDFDGFVEIIYTREVEDPAYLAWRGERHRPRFRSSMIQVENGPTVVDLKGDVLDTYGVTFYGYLAFERVADEVPKEYRPWN